MNFSPRLSLALACALVSGSASAQNASHLVISQVYGGGGSTSTSPTPTYTNDFVEIFNPTNAAVSLNGLSVQYGSSSTSGAGTYSGITALPNVTLQPGHYYLVGEASATNATGAALPTVDTQGTIAMSASAGRVALVTGTAAATCSSTTFIDRVTYGTVASNLAGCTESATAPAPTNTQYSDVRSNPCLDGDNNSTDFALATPAMAHNTSSASPACYGSVTTGSSVSSATANPGTVAQGANTTFTVVVSPGTGLSTSGVTVDLSQIGGSKTAALTASSTNNYTLSYAIPTTTTTGSYSLSVTATLSDGSSVAGSISLNVTQAQSVTPIVTLQTNRSTYLGQTVTTQGVVTLVLSNGFYMQTAGTPAKNSGLDVFTSTTPTVTAGQLVTVTGTLTQYPATTASHSPALEMTTPTINSATTGTMPSPIVLPAQFPGKGATLADLQQYESMLVQFPSLTSVSGTGGSLTETSEIESSNGYFYATATGVDRPFRSPGIDFRDFPTATCPTFANCPASTATTTTTGVARPSNAVLYNDSLERIYVASSLAPGATALDVSAGAVIPNATGIIDYTYSSDSYYDPARFIPLTTITNYTPGITPQPVPAGTSKQVTVAAYNIERFFNPSSADNKYRIPSSNTIGSSSAVNITQAAYNRRLAKVSLAIRTVLNSPDILSIEECENVSVLNDIASQIVADGGPQYVAYGTDSVNTFTNDVGGISVGFLVKASTVDVKKWEQIGQDSYYTNSAGSVQTINDRPSQVLHAGIKINGSTTNEYPLTVIANHLRSLSGIGDLSDTTRVKKELQAEMLATAIQGYQQNGEHVIALGDMNAFEFSDGYTDTLGTITGNLSPAGTSVLAGKQIVSPAATDMALTLDPKLRQSYNEDGVAQILDHIVVTSDLTASSSLQYAHLDADFPLTAYNDATTPARTSDHDAAVLYVNLPSVQTETVSVPAQQFAPGAQTTTLSATISFPGAQPTGAVSFNVDGNNPLNATCTNAGTGTLNCSIDYPTASLSNASHTLTVAVLADSNYAVATGSGTLTPGSSKPAVTVTVPNATIAQGASQVTLTANGTFTTGVFPTGTAILLIDNNNATNASCQPTSYSSATCTATLPANSLTSGTHQITGVITGDSNYSTSYGYGTLTVR